MRAVSTLAGLVLVLTLAACSRSTQPQSDYPHDGGFGTTGAVRFERTVGYPSPATTGADVPFRLKVNTEGQPGMACDIEVVWAG